MSSAVPVSIIIIFFLFGIPPTLIRIRQQMFILRQTEQWRVQPNPVSAGGERAAQTTGKGHEPPHPRQRRQLRPNFQPSWKDPKPTQVNNERPQGVREQPNEGRKTICTQRTTVCTTTLEPYPIA